MGEGGIRVRGRGPNGFDTLERAAKTAAQARFVRGQISVGVQAERTVGAEAAVTINAPLLARYLTLANELAEDGATPPSADAYATRDRHTAPPRRHAAPRMPPPLCCWPTMACRC